MSAPPQNSTRAAERHRRRGGFARVEAALALLILMLAAGLALTLADRIQERRNRERYIGDLRVFAAAFADYFQQHKTWPPGDSADVPLPAPLAEALKDTNWFRGSPWGGNYGWVAPEPAGSAGPARGWGGRGAVTLTAFSPGFPLTLGQADLLYIDRRIDDGNLATGRFRTGFNGWPVYLVEAGKR